MKTFKSLYNLRSNGVLLLLSLFTLINFSCKKYLAAKSDQSISTPTTIDDLEGMMNAYSPVNVDYPSAQEVAADNFYLLNADYLSLTQRQRDFYAWNKSSDIGADYVGPYQAIAYANIVLDNLPTIISNSEQRKNLVRGYALYVRASYHFSLTQLFATTYSQATAGSDLGIALRLTSDVEAKPFRSNMSDTYSSIIGDLQSALPLLANQPTAKYQPSRASTFGLLSRVYLAMGNYRDAATCADSCLNIYNTLIDYNTITATATIPFKQFSDEVIYDARSSPPAALSQSRAKIDTTLYRSYSTNDLRKSIYFKVNADGSQAFKGNYTGLSNASLFEGVATDEIWLTKAECYARLGNLPGALQALNSLLAKRWKTGTFVPLNITDQKQLLGTILLERRKELLFRGLRWMDLKRLNRDAETAQKIYRNLGGVLSELDPNSLRYTFEIDQNAVNISGLIQNP